MNNLRKKRRSSWLEALFSVAIIALIITGTYLIFYSNKNQASTLPIDDQKKALSAKIDSIDSNYPGIKISTETSNDLFAPYAIQYPQSLHSSFNEEISTYITEVKRDYLQTTKEYKESGSKEHWELNISFQTLLHHTENYSFVLVTNNYSDGGNSSIKIRSFHLDPNTGKSITIHDIFEDDASKLDNISILVREAIGNDAALEKFLIPEEVLIHTKPVWENYSNFALTNDELIFYFDQHQIAAGEASAPIIAIPLDKINTIIAGEFKTVVKRVAIKPVENEVNQTEAMPKDPATPEDPGIKKIALTFDDGPHPKVTRQILAILKNYDAKATFFMLGSRVEYYPDIANEVREAGHELGNHSWNHPDLTKIDDEQVQNEIINTSNIIEQSTNQKATVFRPPYGAVNDLLAAQTDLPVILWDIDTLDWKHRNASQLLPIVKKSVRDGSNILMHDIHQSTADGLDTVLAYLKAEGYTFVTVSELD